MEEAVLPHKDEFKSNLIKNVSSRQRKYTAKPLKRHNGAGLSYDQVLSRFEKISWLPGFPSGLSLSAHACFPFKTPYLELRRSVPQ
ncbi:hypothetical protein H0A70_03340 [Alcaligenaceae bacterium]|nr:hypothetical protein [Alcaligenaceae bacterium]